MRAWQVVSPGPIGSGPLVRADVDTPKPGPRELLVKVSVCGVCRTDLHIAEGDLPPHRSPVVPGHEVVGTVETVGDEVERFAPGARVGVAWLRHTCGRCRFCLRGDENLCLDPGFTGWDADGGYAEYAVIDEAYAYAVPEAFDDAHAAPLLCAGIIGYRALKRARVPAGGRLGIYGFGGSAHLAAQVAVAQGLEVHVMTRAAAARELALSLGAASAQGAAELPPAPLDAAILFAPAGELVVPALEALDRGGRLSIAGIHLTDLPPLDYQRHLFQEREVATVTANTRADGREFLDIAARIGIETTITPYDFEDAGQALADLAADRVEGAAVLHVGA